MKVFLGVVAVVLALIALKFGSITPCGILRNQIREAAARAGGMEALVGALPDSMLDGLVAASYGPLTQDRCIAIFLGAPANNQQQRPSRIAPPVQSNTAPFHASIPAYVLAAERQAGVEAKQARMECRAKRLAGELPSFSASAACANPRMLEAFGRANYRYMDLVFQMVAKNTELAAKVDQAQITEAEAKLQWSKFGTALYDEERARDRGQR